MKLVKKWVGGIIKGVAAMAFSPSGKFLVVTGIDVDHKIAVYTTTGKRVR